MKFVVGTLLFAIAALHSSDVQAQSTAGQSGNWSDPATWGGSIPSDPEGDIVIPEGIEVLLDADVECGEIRVQGRLEVERADRTLICDSLVVQGSSAIFEAGTESSRFTNRFVLTLKGEREEEFVIGTHAMGARALLAIMGGTLSIHGEDRVEWTHLGASVVAGAMAITMSEPVDWKTDDILLICPSRTNWNEAETVEIDSVSGDGLTVFLKAPLAYPRSGVVQSYTRPTDDKTWTADLRAEVGLLSRNITIQGAADSIDDAHVNYGFGAHIMVHGPINLDGVDHPSGIGLVKGIEVHRAGQKSLLGRYPWHWHLCQDEGAGQYFSDNSVHISFNRAITIHGTDFTTVENNFCYDHIGHGIFLEDGAERFNVIRKNVVLLTKRPLPGEEVTPSDNSDNEVQNRTPASFWITNPENTFEDNVAAGTEGTGFWFILPTSPLSPSGSLPYYSSLEPYKQPLVSFLRNKAHSCMNGFDIFDILNPDHSIKKNGGWDNDTLHVMDSCTWYANDTAVYAGIGSGGPKDNVIYRDNVFVDNKTGLMLATYNVTEESVFVADSGEGLWDGARRLYRAYDGAGTVRNCYFVGWDAANANLLQNTGGATKHVNHRFSGITTDHAGTVRAEMNDFDFNPPPNIGPNDDGHPRFWSIVLRDEDGSLSGTPNSSVVTNHPFLLDGDEDQPANWTHVYRSDHEFALAIEEPAQKPRPDVTVQRTKPGTPDASVFYIDGFDDKHQLPFIVNGGFTYTYYYDTLPSSRETEFKLDDAMAGDVVLVNFKDFGKLPGLSVVGHSAVSFDSLEELNASVSTGYYIETDGDLFLRPVATGRSQTVTITWSDAIEWSAFDSDGDSVDDGIEASTAGRNPFSTQDLAFQFESNGDFEKWDELNNIAVSQVSEGTLSGRSTGDSQFINDGFNFTASEIELIVMRFYASVATTVELYWERNDAPGFEASRRIAQEYTETDSWQILSFPVGTHSEWNSVISGIRIDPVDGVGDFEVDWIRSSRDDADGDGIENSIEGFDDVDSDGLANLDDVESDGDWMSDSEEVAAGRLPYDASDLRFSFSKDGDFQGWTGTSNISTISTENGILSGTTASRDPWIVNDDFHFPADAFTDLLIRLKAPESGNVQLFFATTTAPNFAAARRLDVRYDSPGEWQLIRFPVSSNAEWSGNITRMRIDPIAVSGIDFEIDWIAASDEDLDDDGIPDIIEGGSDVDGDGLANVEDLDSDSDGQSDRFEAEAGFSIVDSSDQFSMTASTGLGQSRRIAFSAKPNRKYIVRRSEDLLVWVAIGEVLSNETDGYIDFIDTDNLPSGPVFYSLEIENLE